MAGESCTIEPGTVTTSAGLIITCKLLYIDQYMYFFKAINIFLTVNNSVKSKISRDAIEVERNNSYSRVRSLGIVS